MIGTAARALGALVGASLLAGCAARGPLLPEAVPPSAPPAVELAAVPFFPQQAFQCGPAALASVLVHAGVDVTPEALAPQVYLPERRGSLQLELVAATRRHGRIPVTIEPEPAALLAEVAAGRPVLVLQNLRLATWPAWHYAVAIGYDAERDVVLLRSGTTARLATPAPEFLRTWRLGGSWAFVALAPGELPASDDPRRYLGAVAAMEHVADADTLIRAYRAALERWPGNFAARFGLANALRAGGDLAGAESIYRALLAERPGEAAVINNLADLLVARRCADEAMALLDRTLVGEVPENLRPVLEQTRTEALAARGGAGAACTPSAPAT